MGGEGAVVPRAYEGREPHYKGSCGPAEEWSCAAPPLEAHTEGKRRYSRSNVISNTRQPVKKVKEIQG